MSMAKVFLSTWLVRASVIMDSLWGMLMVDRFCTFVHSHIFIYMSLSQILSLMSQPLCISDQLVTAYKSLYSVTSFHPKWLVYCTIQYSVHWECFLSPLYFSRPPSGVTLSGAVIQFLSTSSLHLHIKPTSLSVKLRLVLPSAGQTGPPI